MATIKLADSAEEWIHDADADVQEQVLKRLDRVSDFPEHFLEYYEGSSLYKLRAGDYRAVVDWVRENDVIFVRRIGHRDGFYD